MKFNFIGNIKTVKKQFESRSIKKVDSFRINTFGIRMRHEFLTKYLLRKNSRLCHPFGRSQFPELFTNYNKEIKQQFTTEFIGQKIE
jgi:hypothetical protein